jgi:hypothetical protein
MVFASLLNATAATISHASQVAPVVGVDTAKCSFALPSFCRTFDFLGCVLTTTNLWLNFSLKPKINSLAKMVSSDTSNAQCHEDNETWRDTRKRLSERGKRKK